LVSGYLLAAWGCCPASFFYASGVPRYCFCDMKNVVFFYDVDFCYGICGSYYIKKTQAVDRSN